MKKNLIFLALAAMGLASCNGGFKKGNNGTLYNLNVDKSGTNLKAGDFMILNLIIKNDADSVLFNTYDQGRSYPTLLTPQLPYGLFDAFQQFSEGDSVTVKVLADSTYKKSGRPPGFKGKYINYNIKIEKVIAKGTQTDQVFQDNISKYMKGEADKLKVLEPAAIQKYIAGSKLNFTKTASGLYYVITKPGTGPLPTAGDTASVNYVGKKVDGKVFETNVKSEAITAKIYHPEVPYQPIVLPVGRAKVIPGWDEGLMLLNKGAKATFVIPSVLAYNDQGNGPIGAYTPLVFEVEVTDIVPFKGGPAPAAPANPYAAKPAAAAKPAKK
jgi:FKBP-type peptidyl-prolyl cis-trans isomerase FkpA